MRVCRGVSIRLRLSPDSAECKRKKEREENNAQAKRAGRTAFAQKSTSESPPAFPRLFGKAPKSDKRRGPAGGERASRELRSDGEDRVQVGRHCGAGNRGRALPRMSLRHV